MRTTITLEDAAISHGLLYNSSPCISLLAAIHAVHVVTIYKKTVQTIIGVSTVCLLCTPAYCFYQLLFGE